MAKNYLKIICIVIGILFLVSVAMPAIASASDDTGNEKTGDGFRGVFEKGKPEGKPDNPNKPDKPPKEDDDKEDPSVDKWAVVIGIADYKGRMDDLMYTDDDAQDMYDYLIGQGYPAGNIKLLLNRQAKGDAIYEAIDWMEQWEGPNSECVFFYSGHGSYYDGYNDGDTEIRDESIICWELKHILDGFLRDAFSSFESHKIAFIFDSCFSGGMDDLAGSGRVVVTACDEDELSWDGADWQQNGAFTYYYLEGLDIYNTVEGAFTYGTPLAHDFVLSEYSYDMNPQIYDQYDGDWAF
ncbi:MAG: caspase family protein [Methanomassiliicoccales archaeon]|nr:MAG: caspase family protein [Methanomassiliicoccales archaeon]